MPASLPARLRKPRCERRPAPGLSSLAVPELPKGLGFGRRSPSPTPGRLPLVNENRPRVPRVEPLESERNFQRNDAGLMRELEVRTSRVQRGWIDRLKGYDRLYETKVTDGERAAYGRGPSREASEQAALRNWNASFNDQQ